MLIAALSPYHRVDFWTFFPTLLGRFWLWMTGQLPLADLAPDEIQVLVLSGVAASSALVGCFLVLRRMAMLANSLSHTMLLGIILAFIFTHHLGEEWSHGEELNLSAMLIAAFCMGIVTTYLTETLVKVSGLHEDASNGLVFTSLFSLGIVLVTVFSRNAHVGTEVIMGNVNLLHLRDLELVLLVLGVNLILFLAMYKEFALSTFDSGLAKTFGFSPTLFNYLLMTQLAATAISAFRAVGVLMFLAFVTGPPLTARLLTHRLDRMILYSCLLGVGASISGVALSRHLWSVHQIALSTGGLVVCCIVVFFLFALLVSPERGALAYAFSRYRLKKLKKDHI